MYCSVHMHQAIHEALVLCMSSAGLKAVNLFFLANRYPLSFVIFRSYIPQNRCCRGLMVEVARLSEEELLENQDRFQKLYSLSSLQSARQFLLSVQHV